jgi:hypothetical protein
MPDRNMLEHLSWFRWSNARAIANSRLPQASAFIPAIGYAMLWSREFSEWIGSKEKLGDGILITSLDARLQLLWWGAIFMTIGWLIYLMFCPKIVRRCGDPEDYILKQVGMRNFSSLYQARTLAMEHLDTCAPSNWNTEIFKGITPGNLQQHCNDLTSRGRGIFEPEQGETVGMLLNYQYCHADHERLWHRVTAVTLLCLGGLLFLIPSADVFLRVLRKLVGFG